METYKCIAIHTVRPFRITCVRDLGVCMSTLILTSQNIVELTVGAEPPSVPVDA